MKVFQLGFNKCATKSFHLFFKKNGHKSIHWDGGKWNAFFHNNHKAGKKLCEGMDNVVFWTDLTYIQRHFEVFAMQYPDSKFIYNVRPLDDWIKSRKGHYKKKSSLNKIFINKYKLDKNKIPFEKYWRSEWIIYRERLLEFFSGQHRNRLLIFDIMKDGGSEIVKFLPELSFRHLTFPHAHKKFTSR